jgi:uncharacterized protein
MEFIPKDSDSNLLAGISYLSMFVFPVVGPILIYLFKKDDQYVRFHALQSAAVDFVFMVVWTIGFIVTFVSFVTFFLPFILIPLLMVLYFAVAVGKIFLAWKAYKGGTVKIPVIAGAVEKHLENVSP